jgi:hypothetical protein
MLQSDDETRSNCDRTCRGHVHIVYDLLPGQVFGLQATVCFLFTVAVVACAPEAAVTCSRATTHFNRYLRLDHRKIIFP